MPCIMKLWILLSLLLVATLPARVACSQDLPPIASSVGQALSSNPDLLTCFLAYRSIEGNRDDLMDYFRLKGLSERSAAQEARYKKLEKEYSPYDYEDLARLYKKYGEMYGINWKFAFFQMMFETRNLSYTGEVQRRQNNFAGLGATGWWKRGSDGFELKIERQGGVWKAFVKQGANLQAVYVFSNSQPGKMLPSAVPPGYAANVYLVDRGSRARPLLRQPGQLWKTGDQLNSVEQGVEAHIQHLGLYAGIRRSDRPLRASKSRMTRSHLLSLAQAWLRKSGGRPMTFGDIGKRVQVYATGGESLIWAATVPGRDGKAKAYSDAFRSLDQEFMGWLMSDEDDRCGQLLGRKVNPGAVAGETPKEKPAPKAKPAVVWELQPVETAYKPIPESSRNQFNATMSWTSSPTMLSVEWRSKGKGDQHYRFDYKIEGTPPPKLVPGQEFSLTLSGTHEIVHGGVPSTSMNIYAKGFSVKAKGGAHRMNMGMSKRTPQGEGRKITFIAPTTSVPKVLKVFLHAHAGSFANVRWTYNLVLK